MNMHFSVPYNRFSGVLFKLLLVFRGLLSEHKIPNTLFERLKNYVPELSTSIPDIEMINRCLADDICYLNSKEDLLNVLESDVYGIKKSPFKNIKKNHRPIIKYFSVKIIAYQDIVELNSFMDRVLIIDIDMGPDNPNAIDALLRKFVNYSGMSLYYSLKLSSLK